MSCFSNSCYGHRLRLETVWTLIRQDNGAVISEKDPGTSAWRARLWTMGLGVRWIRTRLHPLPAVGPGAGDAGHLNCFLSSNMGVFVTYLCIKTTPKVGSTLKQYTCIISRTGSESQDPQSSLCGWWWPRLSARAAAI